MTERAFGFAEVVGQDDAKLALVLAAVDPRIGGVLLRGQKGSAKTTLARGLARVLGQAPFVELPLGATEDRLVGSLDTEAALAGEGFRFRPGLLAEAHGGVLYVDEINLLADHLVDTLLDVSVSGQNVVERDGLSHRHPARFVLVGSMNPEEGELRPQLLDRFGFCVPMQAPADVASRVEALRRRLAFDAHPVPEVGQPEVAEVAAAIGGPDGAGARMATAGPVAVPDEVIEAAARLAVGVGAEGLRADLALCRGAGALAGLEGRVEAALDDLRRVAPLALAHRSRRGPFDPPTMAPEDLQRALEDVLGDGEGPEGPTNDTQGSPDGTGPGGPSGTEPQAAAAHHRPGEAGSTDDAARTGGTDSTDGPVGGVGVRPMVVGTARQLVAPPRSPAESDRGRFVRDVPVGDGRPVAAAATVRALAQRKAHDPTATVEPQDRRAQVKASVGHRTIVLCVDLSGSMGADARAAAATGTVLGLLADAYRQRDRVALVGFRGRGAEVLLSPTSSVEVARNRLDDLVTGGETPLAAGIGRALEVATAATVDGGEVLLVVLTDGRATGSGDANDAAMAAAATVRSRGVAAMVLDCETGPVRLHLGERLAAAMGARHLDADALDPAVLTGTIRALASV